MYNEQHYTMRLSELSAEELHRYCNAYQRSAGEELYNQINDEEGLKNEQNTANKRNNA